MPLLTCQHSPLSRRHWNFQEWPHTWALSYQTFWPSCTSLTADQEICYIQYVNLITSGPQSLVPQSLVPQHYAILMPANPSLQMLIPHKQDLVHLSEWNYWLPQSADIQTLRDDSSGVWMWMFHTFVYGCYFATESDHKALEEILWKNLADAPGSLRWMMLCLKSYDFDLTCCPGCEMLLADYLLYYHPQLAPEIELNIFIYHVKLSREHRYAM